MIRHNPEQRVITYWVGLLDASGWELRAPDYNRVRIEYRDGRQLSHIVFPAARSVWGRLSNAAVFKTETSKTVLAKKLLPSLLRKAVVSIGDSVCVKPIPLDDLKVQRASTKELVMDDGEVVQNPFSSFPASEIPVFRDRLREVKTVLDRLKKELK